jgi:hypothetical protein
MLLGGRRGLQQICAEQFWPMERGNGLIRDPCTQHRCECLNSWIYHAASRDIATRRLLFRNPTLKDMEHDARLGHVDKAVLLPGIWCL